MKIRNLSTNEIGDLLRESVVYYYVKLPNNPVVQSWLKSTAVPHDISVHAKSVTAHENMTNDPIVRAVMADLNRRSIIGVKKYGTDLSRKDLALRDWLQHTYEEALDMANYLKRAIVELDNSTTHDQ